MKVGVNSRIYTSEYTGIQNYIRGVYQAILKVDKDSNYIFFQFDGSKKLGENTEVMKLPDNYLGYVAFDNLLVNRLVKKTKVDLFHGTSNVLPIYKVAGVKYVVTIHDLYFLVNPTKALSKLGQYYYKYVLKHTIKNADLILVYSENTKKDILKFFNAPESKVRVIYAGIDDYYFSVKNPKQLIKSDYLFTVMTHPTRKNTHAILEAMSKISEISKTKLVVAGPEHIINQLKDLAKELGLVGNLELFGPADKKQMASLYSHAQAFVFPSLYEGFGFPVLEAMACGCPVITSRSSSLLEVTPDDGWLVDPLDAVGLSQKINDILSLSDNKRNKLIEKNRKFAQDFTWEKTAKGTIDAFFELVEGKTTQTWSDYYKGLVKIKPSNIILHFQYLFKIVLFKPKSVLEIGCGPADHSMFIKKVFPKVEISLLDVDEDLLRKVQKQYEGKIKKAYNYDVFDKKKISKLPKFDVIISQGLLEHFEDEQFAEIINNFSGIGKKGVFSIPSNYYKNRDFGNEILRSKEEVEKLIKKYCPFDFYVNNYVDIGFRTKINLIKQYNLGFSESFKTLFLRSGHLLIVVDYKKKRF